MKANAIEQLVRRLPADCPYYQHPFQDELDKPSNLGLPERLAMALSDPAFLWNLASSYAAVGLPLPAYVCNSAALRANCFLLVPNHPDFRVAKTLSLNLLQMKPARDLLRALHCCRDVTPQQIAERCHWDVGVVRLHGEL